MLVHIIIFYLIFLLENLSAQKLWTLEKIGKRHFKLHQICYQNIKKKKSKRIALETQDGSEIQMASTGTEATFLREEKMRCSKDPPRNGR